MLDNLTPPSLNARLYQLVSNLKRTFLSEDISLGALQSLNQVSTSVLMPSWYIWY